MAGKFDWFEILIPAITQGLGFGLQAASAPEQQQLNSFGQARVLGAADEAQAAARSHQAAVREYGSRDFQIPGFDVSSMVGDINVPGLSPGLNLGISQGTADVIGQGQSFPGLNFGDPGQGGGAAIPSATGSTTASAGGGGGSAAFASGFPPTGTQPGDMFAGRSAQERMGQLPPVPGMPGSPRPDAEGDFGNAGRPEGQDPSDVSRRVDARMENPTHNMLQRLGTKEEAEDAQNQIAILMKALMDLRKKQGLPPAVMV